MKRLVGLVVLLLTGCTTLDTQFYTGQADARKHPAYARMAGEVTIYSTDDFHRDMDALIRQNFMPIGESSFHAGTNQGNAAQLVEHAQHIGAHIVLVSSQDTHTVQGALPLALPQTSTSSTTGQASVYGAGGFVHASGSATTYGTQTVRRPSTVQRADFRAVYLVKITPRVGIIPAELDDVTRQRLQTNTGLKVRLVTDGSSAFTANVLPDDVLLSVGGDVIQSRDHYTALLNKYEGHQIIFTLDRAGTIMEKTLRIHPYNRATTTQATP